MSRRCQSKIARYLRIYAVETVEFDIEFGMSCESQVATSNNIIINRDVYLRRRLFFSRIVVDFQNFSLFEWTA